jgi:7-cyano-7-deazaguanine synthase in queuosine biosynthesis
MKDTILIYSGGMDSTTMLYEYQERIAIAVSFDYGSNHNTREIASKQQIAASSNNDIGLSGLTQQLGYLLGFLSVFVLQETAALGINTKSIMRQQAIIAQIFHPLQQFIRCSA